MEESREDILDRMLKLERETPNDFEFGNKIRFILKSVPDRRQAWSIGEIEENIIHQKTKL